MCGIFGRLGEHAPLLRAEWMPVAGIMIAAVCQAMEACRRSVLSTISAVMVWLGMCLVHDFGITVDYSDHFIRALAFWNAMTFLLNKHGLAAAGFLLR